MKFWKPIRSGFPSVPLSSGASSMARPRLGYKDPAIGATLQLLQEAQEELGLGEGGGQQGDLGSSD